MISLINTDWANADCPNPSAKQSTKDTGNSRRPVDERAEKKGTGFLPRKLFLLVDGNSIDDPNGLFMTGRFGSDIKLNE